MEFVLTGFAPLPSPPPPAAAAAFTHATERIASFSVYAEGAENGPFTSTLPNGGSASAMQLQADDDGPPPLADGVITTYAAGDADAAAPSLFSYHDGGVEPLAVCCVSDVPETTYDAEGDGGELPRAVPVKTTTVAADDVTASATPAAALAVAVEPSAPPPPPQRPPNTIAMVIQTNEKSGAAAARQFKELTTWTTTLRVAATPASLATAPTLKDWAKDAPPSSPPPIPAAAAAAKDGAADAAVAPCWTPTALLRVHDHAYALASALTANPVPEWVVVCEDGVSLRVDVMTRAYAAMRAAEKEAAAAGGGEPHGFVLAWVPPPPAPPKPSPSLQMQRDAAAAASSSTTAAADADAGDAEDDADAEDAGDAADVQSPPPLGTLEQAAADAAIVAATTANDAAPPPRLRLATHGASAHYEPPRVPEPAPPARHPAPASVLAYALPWSALRPLVARYLRSSAAATAAAAAPTDAFSWEDILEAHGHARAAPFLGGVMRSEPHPWRGAAQALATQAAVASDVIDPMAYWHVPHWGVNGAVTRGLKRRKIAVQVHNQDVFTNGCMQNGHFIIETLTHAGYAVDAVLETSASDTKTVAFPYCHGIFGHGRAIRPLRMNEDAMAEYALIIWSTKTPSVEFADALRARNCVTVAFKCGHSYFLDEEWWLGCFNQFRRHYEPLSDVHHARVSDELWTVRLLEHAREATELMADKEGRTSIVPHVWSLDLFALKHWHEGGIDKPPRQLPLWSPVGRRCPPLAPIDIVICEPNLSFVKSSTAALYIATKFARMYPGALGTVHVFCHPDTPESFKIIEKWPIIGHAACDARKEPRIIVPYGRVTTTNILERFSKTNRAVVFVSHSFCNESNYLTYELAALGYPIVHNSRQLGGAHDKTDSHVLPQIGYYYQWNADVFDLTGGARQVMLAATEHATRAAKQQRAAATFFQLRTLPTSKLVQADFCSVMEATIARVHAARDAEDDKIKATVVAA